MWDLVKFSFKNIFSSELFWEHRANACIFLIRNFLFQEKKLFFSEESVSIFRHKNQFTEIWPEL